MPCSRALSFDRFSVLTTLLCSRYSPKRRTCACANAVAQTPSVAPATTNARNAGKGEKLRADFAALQSDMKGLYGDVSEVASERAALAMRSAEEIADRAVALAEEAAAGAKATAIEYKDEAEEGAEENAEELRGHVRANPLQSLLIAGGIGAIFGAVFLRR